ncbi:MAG: biopolymer transporter ExbD [Cellvibrionaceae bacterium]|nr:biopolymer transporter ExbD [Cellvibrionaceae bacterium]MCV6626088.1 biopolymer transporter ExbD [Cellvibrionaceae bacterium]
MIRAPVNGEQELGVGFPDMTALLDVIFILLVFLLLTSQVIPEALQLELPESDNGHNVKVSAHNITISLGQRPKLWAINKREYDQWQDFKADFEATVARYGGKLKPQIFIAGDKQTELQDLLNIFDLLQKHDLKATEVLVNGTADTDS